MFFGSRSRRAAQSQILTLEEIHEGLHRLCLPSSGRRISDKDVRSIQTFLQALDERSQRFNDHRWVLRPRLYAILYNIQATEYMNDFIRDNFTDFHLPFNEQTLPRFFENTDGKCSRADFFTTQDYFLTNIKDIESEKSIHRVLPVSGDMYYIRERHLGHGGCGGVDLVFSRLSIEKFARKRVMRIHGTEKEQQHLIQELKQLRKLHHHHLVKIIGSYTDIECIAYLMKPVAEGTLEEFLSGSRVLGPLEKVTLRQFYGCLAGAMYYLYSHQVRHRDLTARNILISSAGEVYISDFGSSYNWSSKPSSKTKHRDVPTSPDYMAPEVARGDERGTKSDMWSLGIVFFEMTTRLLNHGLDDVRKQIQSNSHKSRVQPYPYANMNVVTSWIRTLGSTNSDYSYDREPLGWTTELLHLEQQHRPNPPQLMKYIAESPSFGVFRCLGCVDDFQNENLICGPTVSRTDYRENSRQTREDVEELFKRYSSKSDPNPISAERTDSIKQWIDAAGADDDLEACCPELENAEDPWEKENIESIDYEDAKTDQYLHSTYEYEFYHPTYLENGPASHSSHRANYEASLSQPKITELAGDTSWPLNPSDTPEVKLEDDKVLRDSGLGFLEYESCSSKDGKVLQPFEELSDRSSLHSENSSLLPGEADFLGSLIPERNQVGEVERNDERPRESSELLFDEVDDRSETGYPWDEASDRSDSEKEILTDRKGDPKAMVSIEERPDAEDFDEARHIVEPDDIEDAEDLPVSPSVLGKRIPRYEDHLVKKVTDASEPFPQVSGRVLPQTHEEPIPDFIDPQDVERQPGKLGSTRSITDKSARNLEGTTTAGSRQTKSNNTRKEPAVPDIVVQGPNGHRKASARLTRYNLLSMDPARRTPIIPRERNRLVPIDADRLMNNTWDMASSAPTSVLSEETKSAFTKFFFMLPSSKQIEDALSRACKEGSASTVKTILQMAPSRNKPLLKMQYFKPLVHAVKGASRCHNKCVRELLAAGVNPNHKSSKTGLTPLHIAVQHAEFKGYANLIWLLLSNRIKADPNGRDRDGELPLRKLFLGADDNPLEPHKRGALIMLLKAGAKPDFALPGSKHTPLHLAVRRQDEIVVAMLLHGGAAVDAKDTSGTTPLQITAKQFKGELSPDHARVLDHLLQHGARVDLRAGALGRTALHWAVIAGSAQAVSRLVEAGADASKKDYEKNDAIGLAIKHAAKLTAGGSAEKLADHVEIMQDLKGAKRCGGKLIEGTCAIETACKSNDVKFLRGLLDHGLDPNSPFRGGTILEFAKRYGSVAAKWLLEEVTSGR
ncbi:ankyrin repeat protein [Pochonia chlamydosporia 170]|uniref:EKC/KEOPS complex subunit BUD32 n=1 Tax=Pochonia chlamydosporia 170 TaxID=1380566 RepID=A0A179F5K0_METCM|nr:ankyrin repeat protein [Pochonia chlamydosporia 170]OAQ60706.1 ankyrin repeat protein [Pochonia chlamydosporia 170]